MQISPINISYYSYNCKSTSKPNFRGTLPNGNKISALINESKRAFLANQKPSLSVFEKIIKQFSPSTTVKHFQEIPRGSNINPLTGAYYANKRILNIYENKFESLDKIIYLNPEIASQFTKLFFFSQFVHEATHVIQEDNEDSTNKILTAIMNDKNLSMEAKAQTAQAMPFAFNIAEQAILEPLLQAMEKEEELPLPVKILDKEILDNSFKKVSGFNCENYIRVVLASVLKQVSDIFPKVENKYIVEYIQTKARHEKEAYINQLNFMKDILRMNVPTDLDYRNILYETFENVTKDL